MATLVKPDLPGGIPVVCFAMKREATPFLRLFDTVKRIRGTPCELWAATYHQDKPGGSAASAASHQVYPGGFDVLILLTGVGTECTVATLNWLFQHTSPSLLVVTGYAGALRSNLAVGDVVIAADVIDPAGRMWPTAWPAKRHGRVFTSNRFIGDSSEKHELGERLQADCVEMESATVAELCAARGVPFGCIRVISDEVDHSIPRRVFGLMEDGKLSLWRLCREMVRSPRIIGELIRLGQQTKLASRNLATALRQLLVASGPTTTR